MPMPRMVRCKVTHGRSVPVSLQGVMHRMRAGDQPLSIPYGVYVRHAWKMELADESIEQVRTAIMEGEQVQSAPTAVPELPVVQQLPGETDEVLHWPLQIPPEEYIRLYQNKKNPSKTILARLELARKLTAEEPDGHTE